jgi:hypothetical protein
MRSWVLFVVVLVACGRGADGEEGLPGSTGAQGPAGQQGTQGSQGAQGSQGTQGAAGVSGVGWADANDVAVPGVVGFGAPCTLPTPSPLPYFDANGFVWCLSPADLTITSVMGTTTYFTTPDCSGSAYYGYDPYVMFPRFTIQVPVTDQYAPPAYLVFADNVASTYMTMCSTLGFGGPCDQAGPSGGCGTEVVVPASATTVATVPTFTATPPLHPVLAQ